MNFEVFFKVECDNKLSIAFSNIVGADIKQKSTVDVIVGGLRVASASKDYGDAVRSGSELTVWDKVVDFLSQLFDIPCYRLFDESYYDRSKNDSSTENQRLPILDSAPDDAAHASSEETAAADDQVTDLIQTHNTIVNYSKQIAGDTFTRKLADETSRMKWGRDRLMNDKPSGPEYGGF